MTAPTAQLLKLCLITDRALAGSRSLHFIVAEAVKGGVTLVQLRENTMAARAFVAEARALKALLAPLGVPLLVNDRVDVALAAGADGVHVGQSDMPLALARRLLGPQAIVGLSVTTAAEARAADVELADYLGVGPVFPQGTKTDAARPLGLEGLAEIRLLTAKLIVGIGGVAAANARAIRSAGADGLAVVSAIMAAEDPKMAAATLTNSAFGPAAPPVTATADYRPRSDRPRPR
jgi:thiamine-phosphate pyrophosphorylase